MFSKLFTFSNKVLKKTLAIIGGIVIVMTFVDFLLKWKIYQFIFSGLSMIWAFLCEYPFQIFIVICICVLSALYLRLYTRVKNSKNDVLEKQISELKTTVDSQIKKVVDSMVSQIKALESKFNDKIFDLEYTLVEFEIEGHRNKNQVGEVSKMIQKLSLDMKRGWGEEDTLLEIREYIKKSGMPNYFFSELNAKIKSIPTSLKSLGDEILKLAQEKLYNPRA